MDAEKAVFSSIIERQATREDIQESLRNLSEYLYRYHGVKPIILLDEYDSPIHAGYSHNYYQEIIELLRGFFGMAFKDNPFLFKAVLTGILRVSKESLFSGLNKISVYSILYPKYGAYFGFTESEVGQLLQTVGMSQHAADVKSWYNGYQIGEHLLYNPWSILKCVADGGVFEPYWVNTSDDALIRQLLIKSGLLFKEQFEALVGGTSVKCLIDENVVFSDLTMQQELSVWSLLLMTGYLTCESFERTDQGKFCQLRIPNREVRNLYRKIIEQWLSDGHSVTWYNEFLGHLLDGDLPSFSYDLQQLMQQTVSFHDMGSEPEAFYHGFILGLTASLYNHPDYETRSNRESGHGRYNYVIFSRDPNKLTIILEFKRVILPTPKPETEAEIQALLQPAAEQALQQIEQLAYLAEIKQRGLSKILKLGLAFSGKYFAISSST